MTSWPSTLAGEPKNKWGRRLKIVPVRSWSSCQSFSHLQPDYRTSTSWTIWAFRTTIFRAKRAQSWPFLPPFLCQDKKGGRVWGKAPIAIGNRQVKGVKAEGFKESGICSSAVSLSIVNCQLLKAIETAKLRHEEIDSLLIPYELFYDRPRPVSRKISEEGG